MKAKLKYMIEQSGDFELETYQPENENYFYINILLCIATEEDEESISYFDLHVCSLDWLKIHSKNPCILRHTMITDRYSFYKIKNYIDNIISQCHGNSWEEIARKLSRYFFWEYEDYS